MYQPSSPSVLQMTTETTSAEIPPTTINKRKKRKLTKNEQKLKIIDSIPLKDRWWYIWKCDPSHTVASIVAQQPQYGGETEVVWEQKKFEILFRKWIEKNKDEKILNPFIFSK